MRDGGLAALDAFLAPEVRRAIEEGWSVCINEQASLAAALADPSFLEAPSRHVALYADHGVVHARDVALMLLQVLDTANGRLIPTRTPDRLGWMKAYGVLLACLHDIGMADCSPGAAPCIRSSPPRWCSGRSSMASCAGSGTTRAASRRASSASDARARSADGSPRRCCARRSP